MKKGIVLLTVFLLLGFSDAQSPDITLKATKIQPLGPDKCEVALELHNAASQNLSYLGMYCSNSGFYVTDNPNVTVTPKPCGKNFPITLTVVRQSYRTMTLELETRKNTKGAKFRIGFKLTEIPKGLAAKELDTTLVKSVVVWSNAIEFKAR